MEADLKDCEDQWIPAPQNKNQQAVNLKKRRTGSRTNEAGTGHQRTKEPTLPSNLLIVFISQNYSVCNV